MRRPLLSILVLFFLLLTSYAGDDPPVVHEDAKLTASDAATGDQFGISVALSGGTVAMRSLTLIWRTPYREVPYQACNF